MDAVAGGPPRGRPLGYVALGDSYTIGTGVVSGGRWPDQLVDRLRARGFEAEVAANLGVNGSTSADVIRDQLPALAELEVDVASLLIGVNDVVQGVAPERYAANVGVILDAMSSRVPSSQIVTVSTPDYTVTPAGADYGDPAAQAGAIRRFNGILAAASRERGIVHVDVHDLSLRAATDRGLVAGDGLHPSAVQYALWVDRIEPVVARMLSGSWPGVDSRH